MVSLSKLVEELEDVAKLSNSVIISVIQNIDICDVIDKKDHTVKIESYLKILSLAGLEQCRQKEYRVSEN